MNKILAWTLAATVALGTVSAAEARDGCGRGFFRGPAGHCRPLGGGYGGGGYRPGYGGVVIAPGLTIGHYYGNRGYWDGRRYYQHRYRHNNGWRYR